MWTQSSSLSGSDDTPPISFVTDTALDRRSATVLARPGINSRLKLYWFSLSAHLSSLIGLCPEPWVASSAVSAWWSVRMVKALPYK